MFYRVETTEAEVEVRCGYEIPGTDDGNGNERICTFEGEVLGEADGELFYWRCPECLTDHETAHYTDAWED